MTLPAAAEGLSTALFPVEALDFYARLNLGEAVSEEERAAWYAPERGGPQGDYAEGMPEKLRNVIDALQRFPASKRAVLTVASRNVSHEVDADAKCLRELHFYLEGGRLCASGFMRAQAASIFPKNIYFIALVMARVAAGLGGVPVGSYVHFVTTLTSGRE
jgi:thymidylate synthase